LRAEGFSCGLGVLYGGLGINKLPFFDQENKNLISSCKFFSILGHQTLDPDPQLEKTLDQDPYPDPHEINADPQPCL
jgi:hypothetical protein